MSLSQTLIGKATELLTRFGEPVEFVRETLGEYNPSTGEAPVAQTVTFGGYGYPQDYTDNEINETTIQRGDTNLLVHKLSEAPAIGDIVTLTRRSLSYRAISVVRITLSGDDVVYEVHLR